MLELSNFTSKSLYKSAPNKQREDIKIVALVSSSFHGSKRNLFIRVYCSQLISNCSTTTINSLWKRERQVDLVKEKIRVGGCQNITIVSARISAHAV